MKKSKKQSEKRGKMLLLSVVVLLMAALNPQPIMAQSALYEVPGLMTVNSLIREYQPGQDVVFNQDGRSCFLLVDRMAGTVTEAEVSGLNSVADMEIDGEMLYFCGEYNKGQVIGYFDINDLFFGTYTVNFVTVPYAPVVNGYTGQLTLTKLEVLTYNYPGDVHVFLTGDVVFGAQPWMAPDYTCLVDALFDGTIWREEVIYEPSGIYFMDDLTVTQTYLVVIGDKHGATGDYSHFEPLPMPGNNYLLTVPSITYCYSPDIDYYPISRPLIETLTGDWYATASYGNFEGQTGVIVTLYSNPCVIQGRWFVPNVSGSTAFRDLKYDAHSDRLFLVPDYTQSTFIDGMYVFDLSNTQVQLYQSQQPGVYSVDVCHGMAGAVASGMTQGGEVGVWRVNTTSCECNQYINLPVLKKIHDSDLNGADVGITYLRPNMETLVAPIGEYELSVMCGSEEVSKETNNQ